MIKELVRSGYFNYDKFLFENFANFDLKLNEVFVLKIFMQEFIKDSLELKKAEKLLKENLTTAKYRDALTRLMEMEYLSINIDYATGLEFFNLDNFFLKIEDYYKGVLSSTINQNEILAVIQKECSSAISPLQYQQLIEYIANSTLTLPLLKKIIASLKKDGKRVDVYQILALIPSFNEESSEEFPLLKQLIADNGWKVK